MIVVHKDAEALQDLAALKEYIMDELNIRKFEFTSEREKFGVKLTPLPDFKALGLRLKKDSKAVCEAIKVRKFEFEIFFE